MSFAKERDGTSPGLLLPRFLVFLLALLAVVATYHLRLFYQSVEIAWQLISDVKNGGMPGQEADVGWHRDATPQKTMSSLNVTDVGKAERGRARDWPKASRLQAGLSFQMAYPHALQATPEEQESRRRQLRFDAIGRSRDIKESVGVKAAAPTSTVTNSR